MYYIFKIFKMKSQKLRNLTKMTEISEIQLNFAKYTEIDQNSTEISRNLRMQNIMFLQFF